jgi:hypothetical protein
MLFCLYCGHLLPDPHQHCSFCGSGRPTPAQVLELLRCTSHFVARYGPTWKLHRAIKLALAAPTPQQLRLFREAT